MTAPDPREVPRHSGEPLDDAELSALAKHQAVLRSGYQGVAAPFALPVSARYDKDHEEWDLVDADNDRLFSIKSWDGGEAIVQCITAALNASAPHSVAGGEDVRVARILAFMDEMYWLRACLRASGQTEGHETKLRQGPATTPSVGPHRVRGSERRKPHVITDNRHMRRCLAVCMTTEWGGTMHAPGCPVNHPMRSGTDRRQSKEGSET